MKFIATMLLFISLSTVCHAKPAVLTKKIDESINTSIMQTISCKSDGQNASFSYKELTAKEVMELFNTDKALDVPVYGIEATGFKPRTQYFLYSVNMCFDKVLMGELVANAKGQLISKKNSPDSRELFADGSTIQVMNGFMNAEPTSFALVPKNGTPCSTITLNPNPIEYRWSDGCYACLWMQDPDACNFALTGKGFKPYEALAVTSKSGGEVIKFEWKATSEGLLFSMIQPAVINKTGGEASLTISRKETGEAGTLCYLWGSDAKAKKPVLKPPAISAPDKRAYCN